MLSREQIREIGRADIVIWGGGALVADNACSTLIPWWLGVITFVTKVLRKPVMAWAHGVVIETYLGAACASLVYRLPETVTVRDQGSYEAVEKRGSAKELRITADPAICVRTAGPDKGRDVLKLAGVPESGRKLVAICPTFWPFYHHWADVLPYMVSQRFVPLEKRGSKVRAHNRELSRLVRALSDRFDADVVLLPRYPCTPWRDVGYLREVAEASGVPGRVFVFERDDLPPRDYLSIFHRFDLTVCTAMHDAIVSSALGRPCVMLYYERKGYDFMKALRAEDRMTDWSCLFRDGGYETALALAENVLARWPETCGDTERAIETLRARARENVDILEALVDRLGLRSSGDDR